MRRDAVSDADKRRSRQIRLDRENPMDKGRMEIAPPIRYRVMSHETRPVRPERRMRHIEANEHKIEGELELNED